MYFQLQYMYSYETIGKGACIKRMGALKYYSTNTIMEKKQTEGEGRGVKDMEFSGVLKK